MPIEQMHETHSEMIEEIETNQDTLELYDELFETDTEYAALRAK